LIERLAGPGQRLGKKTHRPPASGSQRGSGKTNCRNPAV